MSFGFHRDRERERRELEAKEQQQQQRERERERERMEKERIEKERHKQAVDQHFEESLMRYHHRQIGEYKSASGSGGGSVPSTTPWNPPTMPVKGQTSQQQQQQQLVMTMSGGGGGSSSSQAPPSHINSQERDKDKDNRDRYMAAYNLAIDRDRDHRERLARSGQQQSGSSGPPSNNPYPALPRADLSFSVQGYQTAPSPSNNQMQQQHQQQQSLPRKSEQQQQHHLSAADYSKAASGGGVIVGPSERIDRDSMRPDHREQLQRSFELQQQQQRLEARDQRQPTVSYKPYEQTPRLVTGSNNSGGINNNSGGGGGGNNGSNPNIRTSRSPHPQMTPPTSSSSAYLIHYDGLGPGSSQHSYSPNPTRGRSGPSNSYMPNSYMPPPSVSPSRCPAAASAAHVPPYPDMRYSPAPQTAPAPCTSPSANQKKTSPSPLQQQQNMGPGSAAALYSRQGLAGVQVVGSAGISSGTSVQGRPD